jgi:hypothetical protein
LEDEDAELGAGSSVWALSRALMSTHISVNKTRCRVPHPRAFFARGWDFMNVKIAASPCVIRLKANPKSESSLAPTHCVSIPTRNPQIPTRERVGHPAPTFRYYTRTSKNQASHRVGHPPAGNWCCITHHSPTLLPSEFGDRPIDAVR